MSSAVHMIADISDELALRMAELLCELHAPVTPVVRIAWPRRSAGAGAVAAARRPTGDGECRHRRPQPEAECS